MKTKLIIAPFSLQKSLLKTYRKEDNFSQIKIVSKEELLNDKYGHYSKKAISYLMLKKGCNYESARTLLKYARFISKDSEITKVHELYLLKNELINEGLLILNPYYSNLFIDKEIEVYGYSKYDQELLNCLEGNRAEFHINAPKISGGAIYKYDCLDNEILGMLNDIAKLIDEGVSPNDIYVLNNDELAIYYMKKHCNSFGFSINLIDGTNVFTLGLSSLFIKKYKENKDIKACLEWAENTIDPYKESFISLVKENFIEEFSFDQQLDYLVNVFKKHVIVPVKFDNTVNLISEPIERENVHIFVPMFAQGSYPVVYKDNEYLNDSLLKEQNLNTSMNKGMMNEETMLSFFYSNNTFYFSFSNHSFKDNYYLSPWASKLNLKEMIASLPNDIYSKDMGLFLFGKSMDLHTFYRKNSPERTGLFPYFDEKVYRSYNANFSGAAAVTPSMYLKHSYSSLKTYCECPFKYYLSKFLELDPFEGNFASNKGSLAHSVLAECFNKDFDFENSFETHKKEYNWTPKEEMFLVRFKEQVRLATCATLLHYNEFMVKEKVLTEKPFLMKINPTTDFVGFIDKVIVLDDSHLIVVDYKSGSENFDPTYLQEGYSMQLPTYSMLLHNSEEFKDYEVSGLYINSITDSSLKNKVAEDEFIHGYLKLNGITVDDKETIQKIDTTFVDGKSKFIAGIATTKDGGFRKSNKIQNIETLKGYESIVTGLYNEKCFDIRSNKFEISPAYISDNDNACRFCPYKDVCHRKPSQYRKLNKEMEEDIDE